MIQKNPIVYTFDKTEDKHYFAGLLNMAELNLSIALQETQLRTEKKQSESSNKTIITQLFNESSTQSDWNYRVEVLSEFLPVAKMLRAHSDKHAFIQTLLIFDKTLTDLRNFYTHYHHQPIEIDSALFEILDTLLLNATLHIKKQRLKTEDGKALFPKQYEADYKNKLQEHNKKVAEKYTSERNLPQNRNKETSAFDRMFYEKNKRYTEKDYINTYLNAAFHNLLYKTKEGFDDLKETVKSKKKEGNFLSKQGFVFFLSFFLDKKNLEDLFSHIEHFKGTHELRFIVTRWIFSLYAFKDVRRVLRSDYSNDALLLQMIGELNKCPKELFSTLSTQHQLEFFEDINEYYSDAVDTQSQVDSVVTHTIWRKRYSDKFSYFALRFLDEFAGFTNLKFQVVIGTYTHDSRTKELSGIQRSTERTIKEDIKVFGKLSEIDKLKKAYFTQKKSNTDTITESPVGWEEFPIAHYKLDNNNIPIYLSIPGFQKETTPLKDRTQRLSRREILEQLISTGFIESEPIAFLSVNELPALLYEIVIKKTSAREIENRLIAKIMQQITTIKRFSAQSEINKHTIPKRLLHLISTTTHSSKIKFEKLLKDIDTEIHKSSDHLREIDEILARSKHRTFNNKDRGEIATWLADDIKRFAGKEIRQNWKSHQHSELQALLAFYTNRKEEVRLLLEQEIKLLITTSPLLQTAFSKNSLEDFSKAYLLKRQQLLSEYKKIILSVQNSSQDNSTLQQLDQIFAVFDKRLYVTSDIDQYKTELLQKPINIPRGIFDTEDYTPVQKGDATNFQPWFKAAAQNETYQKFYQFPRLYDTTRLNPLSGKGLLEQNKNTPVSSDVFKNEKRLREIARLDFYVLEMAKHMMRQMYPSVVISETFLLKDVFQTKKEKEQIKNRAAKQSQRKAGDQSTVIIDDSHLLLKRFPVTIELGNKKIVDTVALKDIGAFRRLEKDSRVQALLSYTEKTEWTKTDIELELENYEKIRKESFFKEVHLFEKIVLEKTQLLYGIQEHPSILEQNGHPNFKRYVAYHFFSDDSIMFDKVANQNFIEPNNFKNVLSANNSLLEKAYFLILIRNKFSHNQLPEKDAFLKMHSVVEIRESKVGDYLLRVFTECIA